MNNNYRALAHSLLRSTLGGIFLVYGVEKFRNGHALFVSEMLKSFAGKLPLVVVRPFAWLLPFFEVAIGALLVVGLFTEGALIASGILMTLLAAGAAALGASSIVAENVVFSLTVFTLLFLHDRGGYSLDHLLRRYAQLSRARQQNGAAD